MAEFTKEIVVRRCERCGHEWQPQSTETRQCPKCKTAYWDVPKQTTEGVADAAEPPTPGA